MTIHDAFLSFFRRFVKFKQGNPGTWHHLLKGFFLAEARRKYKRFPSYVFELKKISPILRLFDDWTSENWKERRDRGINGASHLEWAQTWHAHVLGDVATTVAGLARDWFVLVLQLPRKYITIRRIEIPSCREFLFQLEIRTPMGLFRKMEMIKEFTALAGDLDVDGFIRVFYNELIRALDHLLGENGNQGWKIYQVLSMLNVSLDDIRVTQTISFYHPWHLFLVEEYFERHLHDYLVTDLGLKFPYRFLQGEGEAKVGHVLNWKSTGPVHEYRGYLQYWDLVRQEHDVCAVFYHYMYKCIMTSQISHYYDLLPYIISRLDLSKVPTKELLYEYCRSKGMSEKEYLLHGFLIDFIIEQSLLYATFQSNNKGLKGASTKVLILVLQYYLVPFERDYLAEKMFQGQDFFSRCLRLADTHVQGDSRRMVRDIIEKLTDILVSLYKFNDSCAFGLFIKYLFDNDIDTLVERFFLSFLRTSNEQVKHNLDRLNADLPSYKRVSFEDMVRQLADFLVHCMKKTYLQDTPEKAAKNFNDVVGRFSPENIIKTLYEVLVFRELPFQHEQWMPVLLVKYHEQGRFGNDQHARKAREMISDKIVEQATFHNKLLKPTTKPLHQFFIDDIFKPFLMFYLKTKRLEKRYKERYPDRFRGEKRKRYDSSARREERKTYESLARRLVHDFLWEISFRNDEDRHEFYRKRRELEVILRETIELILRDGDADHWMQ